MNAKPVPSAAWRRTLVRGLRYSPRKIVQMIGDTDLVKQTLPVVVCKQEADLSLRTGRG